MITIIGVAVASLPELVDGVRVTAVLLDGLVAVGSKVGVELFPDKKLIGEVGVTTVWVGTTIAGKVGARGEAVGLMMSNLPNIPCEKTPVLGFIQNYNLLRVTIRQP